MNYLLLHQLQADRYNNLWLNAAAPIASSQTHAAAPKASRVPRSAENCQHTTVTRYTNYKQ